MLKNRGRGSRTGVERLPHDQRIIILALDAGILILSIDSVLAELGHWGTLFKLCHDRGWMCHCWCFSLSLSLCSLSLSRSLKECKVSNKLNVHISNKNCLKIIEFVPKLAALLSENPLPIADAKPYIFIPFG